MRSYDMPEDWRYLRAGGRIRIVRLPTEWNKPNYFVHRETRRIYKKLIALAYGGPWILCPFGDRNGNWEYHALCVNDDSWVKVKKRRA